MDSTRQTRPYVAGQSFGYTAVDSQAFSVIVYVCAFIGLIFWARVADLTSARGFVLAASTVTSIIGYAMLISLTNKRARFAAACLIGFSAYPNMVLQMSWATMSFAGYTRRSVAELVTCLVEVNEWH